MNKKDLEQYFETLDDDKKAFALDTIDEYLYFKGEIEKLRQLPLIRVDKKNPEKQLVTPAGKLIKDYSQVVDAKRSTLLRILYRVETTAADRLEEMLKEYE